MTRELTINLYLIMFRLIFNIFKLFPLKKKTTFVTSFGDNVLYTINELEKQTDDDIIILKTNQCRVVFGTTSTRTVLLFEPAHVTDWICSIYHLATCRMVFVDNYFGFLAVANFRKGVTCVQLWHAAGAMKRFGLKDPSNENRSMRANKRFRQVYKHFDHVVVGSRIMANIFKDSFGLMDAQMLRTGVPRTDFFFNPPSTDSVLIHLMKHFPLDYQKKVILYAPTFRDDTSKSTEIGLEFDQLYRELRDEYVLLLRLHPTIQRPFVNQHPDFIMDVSDYPDVHRLLLVTDLLITDYSSIPFEFSLLNKPMIFFAYDLENYKVTRGFWQDYESLVPGPIVKDTETLIDMIREDSFDFEQIQSFASEWNEFSNGLSSKRLIETLYQL